jgi:hypothetical protein
MALVHVSATAYYRCRDAAGRFTPTQMVDIGVDVPEDPSGDYTDALFAEATANAPEGCVETAVSAATVVAIATAGAQETPAGVETNVRAETLFRCTNADGDQKIKPIEYSRNWPGGTALEDILTDIELVGLNLEADFREGFGPDTGEWDCGQYLGLRIIEPLYWAMSLGI